MHQPKAVYLVKGGCRTPFLKFRGQPGPARASDLAVPLVRQMLLQMNLDPQAIDETILGCVMPTADEANIARLVALRGGVPEHVPAWTVQRNCASGLQAVASGVERVALGAAHLVLVGGTEAMSHGPLLWSPGLVRWLAGFQKAKSVPRKLQALARLRLKDLPPIVALMRGLSDPLVNLSMGQTAEELAYLFGIDRLTMDQYAVRSHQRAHAAHTQGHLEPLVPVYTQDGRVLAEDDGVRADSSTDKLGTLKAVFDSYGNITAGNSSQVSDGAAMMFLASEEALETHKLTPVARVHEVRWGGLSPRVMGLGPVHAMVPLLQQHGLRLDDIDHVEINEAFAAQVIACQKALGDPEYLNTHFGLEGTLGHLDEARLNPEGGAVALGHPVGASGARLVLHMAHRLQQQGGKRALGSLCIGGGQGGAVLLESIS